MKMLRKLLLVCAVLSLAGCFRNPSTAPTSQTGSGGAPSAQVEPSSGAPAGQDDSNLLMGNPSRAGSDPNNYLLERPQHAMSYNRDNGGPNWVSWHLEKSNLGNVRRGDFLPDPMLPADWQIRPSDYRGSGYDRGHICPSGDRTRSKTDNTATFVMSNMLPQAAALNQQVWKDLEDYSRSLTKANELYTIAGGTGSVERIANGKVNVPTVCWKIIVVLPRGNNDLSRIDANTRVIAVSMPNRQRQEIADSKWAEWITSVAQIEKTTGYDFLSALPDDVERVLEQKVDSGRAMATSRTTIVSRETTVASGDTVTTRVESPGVVVTRTTTNPTTATQATPPPALERPIPNVANQGAADVQVWVNTRSGVYHYPGARWYGNTKRGEYMSESQALAQGYRAAR